MRVAPGEYELFYGTSSAARDLQSVKVTLRDSNELNADNDLGADYADYTD